MAWKQTERDVAKALGGVRRGPMTRNYSGAKNDVIHDVWSIEVKNYTDPSLSIALGALDQAIRSADRVQIPIAIVKRKGTHLASALVFARTMDLGEADAPLGSTLMWPPNWTVTFPRAWGDLLMLVRFGVRYFSAPGRSGSIAVMKFSDFKEWYCTQT